MIRKDEAKGALARVGEMRNVYKVLVRKLEGHFHLEDILVGREIILKLILRKEAVTMWSGFIWLRITINGGML
jgi:hypothetical protein